MIRKRIIRDMMGTGLLLAGGLASGLAVNEMRFASLPWVYAPPEIRFKQTGKEMNQSAIDSISRDEGVARNEVQKVISNHEALIIDARPANNYSLGHIPSAINLPRNDFDERYRALQPTLQLHRNQTLIIYCSNFHCPDSQIVAAELLRLGYQHVRLFRGGWDDWETAGLPEEKP